MDYVDVDDNAGEIVDVVDDASGPYDIFNPDVQPVLPRNWQSKAACSGLDPDIFFPQQGDDFTVAKGICRQCPVLYECRAIALMIRVKYGIWGGMTEKDRRAYLKGRSRWNLCTNCGSITFGYFIHGVCCNNNGGRGKM